MPSSSQTENGNLISFAILGMVIEASCFRAIRGLSLTRLAACSERQESDDLLGVDILGRHVGEPFGLPYFLSIFFSTLAHVSFRATVRLKTGCPGLESGSTQ